MVVEHMYIAGIITLYSSTARLIILMHVKHHSTTTSGRVQTHLFVALSSPNGKQV